MYHIRHSVFVDPLLPKKPGSSCSQPLVQLTQHDCELVTKDLVRLPDPTHLAKGNFLEVVLLDAERLCDMVLDGV